MMQLSAYLGNAYLVSGRLDEAEALAERGTSGRLGSHGRWKMRSGRAGADRLSGRGGGRERRCIGSGGRRRRQSAVEVPLPFMPAVLGELAHAAALLGDLPAAEEALAAGRAIHGSIRARLPAVGRISTALGRGRPRASCPEPSLSRWTSPNHARDRGQLTFQILALHDVARLGPATAGGRTVARAGRGAEGR